MSNAVIITGELKPAILATALDCDGTIGLTLGSAGNRIFQVSITNTSRDLLEYLRALADIIGKVNGPYIPENFVNKVFYVWAIPTAHIVPFLNMILPYLIIKRRQAFLMIDVRSAYERNELIGFEGACQLMRELNQEGNAGPGGGRPRKQDAMPAADEDI